MGRQSNFEAYRIVCILLIVIMHTFGMGTGQLNTQLGIFINVIGNIGVTGFVLLSGYFGIQLKTKKLAKMDLMLIFWSLASYSSLFLNHEISQEFGLKALVTCIIPVISHKYWFISAYFCLCILSPFINEYLEMIDKKRHRQLILGAGVLFLLLPTVFFFDQTGDGGKGIVNMVLAYIIGRYIGMYYRDKKCSFGKLMGLFLATVAVNFMLNDGVFLAAGSQANYFARDNSLLTMAQAVLLLLMFMQWKCENKIINILAVNVLAVYILEDTIKIHLQTFIPYTDYMGQAYYLPIVLGVGILVFVLAVALEGVRKLFFNKAENLVIDKIGNRVEKWTR